MEFLLLNSIQCKLLYINTKESFEIGKVVLFCIAEKRVDDPRIGLIDRVISFYFSVG